MDKSGGHGAINRKGIIMADFFLKAYSPEVNKYQQFFMGADGWLYGDLRIIETNVYMGSSISTQTSIAYFEPYCHKGVVYLKFCPRGNQGFENHYLSVNKDGQLGLYNWLGATGWKLDFESHLVSLYNGCNVALAGGIYKADNSWPGLRFRKEENPDLWAALAADYSPANSLEMERTATYGGKGGVIFDGALPKGATHISKLSVHAGSQINAITPSYTDPFGTLLLTSTYGGPASNAGTWTDINLDLDEQITEVQGRADTLVRQLTFKTNKGKTFGPYGSAMGTAFSITGKPILGFFGRSGAAIDQLGFKRLNSVSTLRTPAYGGTGGSEFDGTPPAGAVRMGKLNIHAGTHINTIAVEWWDAGGGPLPRGSYGGSGQNPGTWYEHLLYADEHFTDVSGMADSVGVHQITFKSNRGKTFGPFGTAKGTPFSVTGKHIVGFYGRGGWSIDQLGFVIMAPPVPKASAALEFNGVDSYVVFDGPLPIGQQVTLEMWARGAPKETILFWLTDDARLRQFSAHVPWSNGAVIFDAAANANGYDRLMKSALPHDGNTWNHWAFVRNAITGRMAVYKNGDLFTEVTLSKNPMATCNRFVLGADGNGGFRYAGAIAEVRLWNTERTAAQIKDNMKRVIQGPDTGLVLSWSLDGVQADQVVMDGSGSGRHGKLMGVNKSVTPPTALTT